MKADATNHPISWFKREADAGTLDLSPRFQRRPVWDDDQSAFLIDSILHEYPIPEVYLRSETDDDGVTTHQVVDGQQRLRAILRFCENDLILEGPDISPKLASLSFEDLDQESRKSLFGYKVVVREMGASSDAEIRELFRRVNLNSVDLNDQELRHSQLEGHFIETVEALADDPWWVEQGIFTVREVRRMLDVEFISELLVGLMAGPQNKKDSLDKYFEDFDSTFEDEAFWRKEFKSTRELVGRLIPPPKSRAWRGKSDFYSLFLVVGDLLYNDVRFSNNQVKAVAEGLARFRAEVDQAKRAANTEVFDDVVHEYADAVTRATSDLNRRIIRDEILRTEITTLLGAK